MMLFLRLQVISMDRDWKLVLLFVQVDQLCACDQQQVNMRYYYDVTNVERYQTVQCLKITRSSVFRVVQTFSYKKHCRLMCLCRFTLVSRPWLKRWMMLYSYYTLRYNSHNAQCFIPSFAITLFLQYTRKFYLLFPFTVLQLKRTIVSVALWDGEHGAFQHK